MSIESACFLIFCTIILVTFIFAGLLNIYMTKMPTYFEKEDRSWIEKYCNKKPTLEPGGINYRRAYYPSEDPDKANNGFVESQFDLTPNKDKKDGFNF